MTEAAIDDDGTRSFYDANAETYAAATLNARVDIQRRRFVAALPAAASVVDLGCGSGRDLLALSLASLDPIGVDYSPPMARIARRTSGCPVLVADMRELPLRTASAHGVWAMASLLHLPRRDLRLALAECRRVLRQGGVLYASVKVGAGEGSDRDGRFFTFHSQVDWRRALRDAGFDSIRIGVGCGRREARESYPDVRWLSSLSYAA